MSRRFSDISSTTPNLRPPLQGILKNRSSSYNDLRSLAAAAVQAVQQQQSPQPGESFDVSEDGASHGRLSSTLTPRASPSISPALSASNITLPGLNIAIARVTGMVDNVATEAELETSPCVFIVFEANDDAVVRRPDARVAEETRILEADVFVAERLVLELHPTHIVTSINGRLQTSVCSYDVDPESGSVTLVVVEDRASGLARSARPEYIRLSLRPETGAVEGFALTSQTAFALTISDMVVHRSCCHRELCRALHFIPEDLAERVRSVVHASGDQHHHHHPQTVVTTPAAIMSATCEDRVVHFLRTTVDPSNSVLLSTFSFSFSMESHLSAVARHMFADNATATTSSFQSSCSALDKDRYVALWALGKMRDSVARRYCEHHAPGSLFVARGRAVLLGGARGGVSGLAHSLISNNTAASDDEEHNFAATSTALGLWASPLLHAHIVSFLPKCVYGLSFFQGITGFGKYTTSHFLHLHSKRRRFALISISRRHWKTSSTMTNNASVGSCESNTNNNTNNNTMYLECVEHQGVFMLNGHRGVMLSADTVRSGNRKGGDSWDFPPSTTLPHIKQTIGKLNVEKQTLKLSTDSTGCLAAFAEELDEDGGDAAGGMRPYVLFEGRNELIHNEQLEASLRYGPPPMEKSKRHRRRDEEDVARPQQQQQQEEQQQQQLSPSDGAEEEEDDVAAGSSSFEFVNVSDVQSSSTGTLLASISRALWVPDADAESCYVCGKPFKFLLRRRHHCRACGCVMCGDCVAQSGSLPKSDNKVCRSCFEIEKQQSSNRRGSV